MSTKISFPSFFHFQNFFGYNKSRDGTMKKTKKKKKCKLKLNNLLILLSIITSGFLIYRISQLGPIEPFIRFTVVLLLLGIDFLFFYYKKSLKKVTALLGMIAFIGINLCITNFIGEAYASIDSMNKSKTVYSSSLITKKSSTIETIDDVTALKIGILNNTLSIDNYVIAREIVEEHSLEKDNELVEYEDVDVMLQDLYDEKIDAMLISSNYKEMFQTTEGFENVESEVKVIFAKDKTVEKNQVEAVDHNSSVEKPFTVLLMGVDSEKEGLKKNAYANGDALILITFNPETLNTTMMSIPRIKK